MDAAVPHEEEPPPTVTGAGAAGAEDATLPGLALPMAILEQIAAQTAFSTDLCILATLTCRAVRSALAGPQHWPGLVDRWWANRARRSCLGWRKALFHASTAGRELLAVELLACTPPDLADAKRSELVAVALDRSAEQGHRDVVAVLLDAGWGRVSSQALRALARRGHSDLVQRILQEGPATTEQAEAALQGAAEGGHVEGLRLVLEDRGSYGGEWRDDFRPVAVAAAAAHGHGAALRVLLGRGWPGRDAVEAAASGGHDSLLLQLLGRQPAASCLTRAVVAAAGSGHLDTVRLLVEEHGAVVPGGRAVTAAARGGHTHVLAYLLEAGHGVDAADWTAAALGAAECGHAGALELLLARQGVAPGPGQWPLEAAIRAGHVGAVGAMLARGAPPSAIAMRDALKGGHVAVVRQLLAAGGALPLPSAEWTVTYAAEGGCVELVRMVLDLGIAPPRGALRDALQHGHDDVLQMLLQHEGAPVEAMLDDWRPVVGRVLVTRTERGVWERREHGGRDGGVRVLLEHGGEAGRLAVIEGAARAGHIEFVQLALERFGDGEPRQRAKQMARPWAASGGHKDVLRLLRQRHW